MKNSDDIMLKSMPIFKYREESGAVVLLCSSEIK